MNKLFKITGFVALFTALFLAVLYALGELGSEAVSLTLIFEVIGILCYASSIGGKMLNNMKKEEKNLKK